MKRIQIRSRRFRRAQERERGAVFIEFALVVPILLLLAMGIVEYGIGWKVANDVNAAARDAARVGTRAPAYNHADRDIVRQVAASLYDAQERDVVERVVVFKANGANDTKPSSTCLTLNANGTGRHGVSGVCNVYGPDQVRWVANNPTDNSNFTASGGCLTRWDSYWCPTGRANNAATGNLDWLGVYIVVKHRSLTNFGFGEQTVQRGAVFRIEPAYKID